MGAMFQIFIRNLTGKHTPIEVDSNITVDDLKRKIQEKEKIDPRKQRLLYQGKQLEEGNTLGFYNIKKDSTINLVLRLIGG